MRVNVAEVLVSARCGERKRIAVVGVQRPRFGEGIVGRGDVSSLLVQVTVVAAFTVSGRRDSYLRSLRRRSGSRGAHGLIRFLRDRSLDAPVDLQSSEVTRLDTPCDRKRARASQFLDVKSPIRCKRSWKRTSDRNGSNAGCRRMDALKRAS
jgi:hypothetical protein